MINYITIKKLGSNAYQIKNDNILKRFNYYGFNLTTALKVHCNKFNVDYNQIKKIFI